MNNATKDSKPVISYGVITECRGKACGAQIIFVEYLNRRTGLSQKTCVDAKPIFMIVPVFDKTTRDNGEIQKPIRWDRKLVFRPHHETCPNVDDFKKKSR